MTTTIQHPGKILGQRLESLGISPTELARQLQVPANRITQELKYLTSPKSGEQELPTLRIPHVMGDHLDDSDSARNAPVIQEEAIA